MSSNNSASGFSNTYTLVFTVALCALCAIILAAMASGLKNDQERAIALDRNKQLLMASHLLSHEGHLLVQTAPGQWGKALVEKNGSLTASPAASIATDEQIRNLFKAQVRPMFVDKMGALSTPDSLDIDVDDFFNLNQKTGFAQLPHKLIYIILANGSNDPLKDVALGYIIPVNGFGLWGPIYGYIAIDKDAKTVLGISWYQHVETPGLGANISDASWQSYFPGKSIFQRDRTGSVNYATSPIGIVVIKGKVSEVYGDDPRSESAVDGMSGATITGNGVSRAYKDVLEQYRPFLLSVMKNDKSSHP